MIWLIGFTFKELQPTRRDDLEFPNPRGWIGLLDFSGQLGNILDAPFSSVTGGRR